MRILVVGASGYVGGRLVPLLLDRGHELVLLGRSVHVLETRFPKAKVLQGDLLEAGSLPLSLEGVQVAYYLAHSMGSSDHGFAERDLLAAANFGKAAFAAGVAFGWMLNGKFRKTVTTLPFVPYASSRSGPVCSS